ncbi:hypothetical protein [Syntrophotalea acetylenivorans]|uniref:hypothetical protein n=1 Tax=Syntrophotalea acetylenivorans TaxID=1842532 RepID=UPI001313E724|nr:hypothetical protein [Syntrophotalea acetylenivorans]
MFRFKQGKCSFVVAYNTAPITPKIRDKAVQHYIRYILYRESLFKLLKKAGGDHLGFHRILNRLDKVIERVCDIADDRVVRLNRDEAFVVVALDGLLSAGTVEFLSKSGEFGTDRFEKVIENTFENKKVESSNKQAGNDAHAEKLEGKHLFRGEIEDEFYEEGEDDADKNPKSHHDD